jgi:hypothetical protein
VLKTPPLSSEFTMHRGTVDGTEMLVCTVGKTVLHYEYRCLKDLQTMLKAHGDWMELGSGDASVRRHDEALTLTRQRGFTSRRPSPATPP